MAQVSPAKMDSRRSWPWRKKSSDKHSHPTDADAGAGGSLAPSPARSLRHLDEQESVKGAGAAMSEHHADDPVVRWHQCQERNKHLNDRLAAALADITAKDNLVKQHAKVAEEAVTGWEKAEGEALTLKKQLDTVQQQKLATEDRVSHLDGALKECMRQLRHVREEQETKVHEAVVRKTREFERVRAELEAKLADTGRQLLETSAHNAAMSGALQERAKALAELTEARNRAEAENKVLLVRVEAADKENAGLKYEVHVLNKEMEIRNEERDYSKKAADIANKQQLDNVKKVAKLEAECQRLRLLVRKRLPGPAALAQMKAEVDALGWPEDGPRTDGGGRRRKSLGPQQGSRNPHSSPAAAESQQQQHDGGALADRMYGLEEENTLLKEALARRNEELQSARLMCARTATKLSSAEDQVDSLRGSSSSSSTNLKGLAQGGVVSSNNNRGGTSSRASNSEDSVTEEEMDCADVWASALVAQLDQFRKDKGKDGGRGKGGGGGIQGGSSVSSINLDIMDDFAEMEKLANLTSPAKQRQLLVEEVVAESEERAYYHDKQHVPPPPPPPGAADDAAARHALALEEALARKGSELAAAAQTIKEVSDKLATAEEQLAALQSRNAASEKQLVCLQERLDIIFEAHAEGADMAEVLHEVRQAAAAAADSGHGGTVGSKRFGLLMKEGPAGVRELGYWAHNSVFEAAADGGGKVGKELAQVVTRIVRVVEALAQATGTPFDDISDPAAAPDDAKHQHPHQQPSSLVQPCKLWKNPDLHSCVLHVVALTNAMVQGKKDVTAFLTGLVDALGVIADLGTDAKMVSQLQDELRSLRQEKAAVESHMRAELSRLSCLELELEQLKHDRAGMERCLAETNHQSDNLKAQLEDAEQQLRRHTEAVSANLRSEDELLEDELMSLSASKADLLETRVKAADVEMNRLQEKVATLEVELQGERMRHQEVMAKFQEIQEQLQGNGALSDSSARRSTQREVERSNLRRAEEEELRARKDREIAAAAQQLAECQRTILLLGKHLKTLSSPAHSTEMSTLESSSDSASSLEKISRNMDLLRSQSDDVLSSNDAKNGHYRESPSHQHVVGGFTTTPPKRKSGTEIPWTSCISPQGSSVSTGSYTSETESKADRNGSEPLVGHHHAGSQSQYGTPQAKIPDPYGSRDNGYHARGASVGSQSYGHDSRTPFSLPSSPSPSDSASMSSPSKSPATVLPSKLRGPSLNGRGNVSLSKSMDSENGMVSLDQRSNGSGGSSTFSRFYSRMRSTSSVG